MPSDEAVDVIIKALSTVPYLTDLDPALIAAIAQQTKRQTFDTGQVVFLEGDQNVALYVVQSGWLKAVKLSADGREQVLHFIGPGEAFNAIGVLVQSANPASVIALEPSVVWTIQQQAMLNLIDQHPQLGRVLIQRLAERVQQLIHMVEDFSLRTIEARLARYLLQQANEEHMQRPQWATQAELANRLGTVPDVLNRALRGLEKDNLIHVERHQIQILDFQGLEVRAKLPK